MTRKHFLMVADVLKGNRRTARTEGEHLLLDRLTTEFAGKLADLNTAFDRGRFLRHAGHGERPDAQGVLPSDLELSKPRVSGRLVEVTGPHGPEVVVEGSKEHRALLKTM
jgi:hypothetical protein